MGLDKWGFPQLRRFYMRALTGVIVAGAVVVALLYAATLPPTPPMEILGVWDLYSQADTLVDVPPGDEWSWEFRADGKVVHNHVHQERDHLRTEETRILGIEETEEGCFRVNLSPQHPDNPFSRIWLTFNSASDGPLFRFLFCAEELTIYYPSGGICVCHKRR